MKSNKQIKVMNTYMKNNEQMKSHDLAEVMNR